MGLEIRTIESGGASEADYQAVIDSSPDSTVLHTLEWRRVLEDTLGDPSCYFVCYDGGQPAGVLPAFVRTTELGAVFNSLAFSGSYGGVCLHGEADRPGEIFKALISHALDFAREAGCLTATFIMPPLRAELREWYVDAVQPDFIYDRITQLTDLTQPPAYKPSVRNHIRKAHKLGVTFRTDLAAENIDLFYSAYLANMEFIGVEPKTAGFFDSVVSHMAPSGRARFYFAFAGDALVSGLLVFSYRDGITSHETCFDRDYKKYQGNSYLLDVVLKQAREEGYEYFNWGASESRECGVYKFKEAWGAGEVGYSYFTRMLRDCSALRRAGAASVLSSFSRFYYVIPFSWLEG